MRRLIWLGFLSVHAWRRGGSLLNEGVSRPVAPSARKSARLALLGEAGHHGPELHTSLTGPGDVPGTERSPMGSPGYGHGEPVRRLSAVVRLRAVLLVRLPRLSSAP